MGVAQSWRAFIDPDLWSARVLHGMMTYVLVDEDGQTADVHSISAGLDYPGVGPEHSYWKESGRVNYRHRDR